MKINVTVDLDEFYADDESTVFESVKRHIANVVKQEVMQVWKLTIGEEFNRAVIRELNEVKEQFIVETFQEKLEEAMIISPYKEAMPIKAWLELEFKRILINDNVLKNFLTNQTKTLADNIGKELKSRYDLLFASQLVAKLNENGMLKDDVAKLLLDS